MKTISIILLALGISFGVQAQYKKASLQATGLTCAMCSRATFEALQTLPFVDKIDTDLNSTTFELTFKSGVPVNIDAIRQKVEDAGFSVGKLVVAAQFDGVKVQNDTHLTFGGNTLHFMQIKDQVLNGEKLMTVIDKHFVSAKQFKKFSTTTSMSCYQTGMMSDCCKPDATPASKRIYHVTI
ncbi:heavy-metal-associated domain-containing protein [Chitinophaga nivalis]|uniref:Heavy-metal-associated domain-containing protein n=1 Tax=Chitinophaga nivalis TaxID=2991709 RepID=A0ABT3ISN2_9BACT|nr:heavy-metal-associated domain-containing protein [Chitinophaga nivalis]MCW3463580.1 heavy-metal-associated domain-containing protein [Chitinophaga nivalis]MCW3486730.1 heavy-metal-associated domain-containing protein [Chitinophaga nivalis]